MQDSQRPTEQQDGAPKVQWEQRPARRASPKESARDDQSQGWGGGEAVPSKEKDEVKEGPVQCILLNNPHLPSLP